MMADIEGEDNQPQPTNLEQYNKTNRSIKEKWNDSEYRDRFIHFLFICGGFITLGCAVGQIGPALLDLQIITNTDLEQASAFLTGGSVGYLCGALFCGLIYSKVNADLQIFLSLFSLGLAVAITPFCTYLESMVFIRFTALFASAFLGSACNAFHMELWGTEGQGLLQFLHFSFALGGVLSPLYTAPFLARKTDSKDVDCLSNETLVNKTFCDNSTISTELQPTETDVKWAFMITSIMIFISAISFFILYLRSRERRGERKSDIRKIQRQLPRSMIVITMAILCLFYLEYAFIESSFATFLMTFLVTEYDSVSKSEGSFATAIFWASFAAGRFLSAFLSKLLSPLQILVMCLSLMIVTFTCFLLCAYFAIVDGLLVFTVFAGLGMSAVFAAGISWTEENILKVDGRVAAAILTSSSFGAIINPLILGHLMESVSNMWFPYILLIQTFLASVILAILVVFSKLYLNKRFGSMREVKKMAEGEAEECQEKFLHRNLQRKTSC